MNIRHIANSTNMVPLKRVNLWELVDNSIRKPMEKKHVAARKEDTHWTDERKVFVTVKVGTCLEEHRNP